MPRRYRRNSHYGDGLRIHMDRERRAVWRARLHMFRRGRKITPLYEDIGLAMLRRLGANGRFDPCTTVSPMMSAAAPGVSGAPYQRSMSMA